MHGWHGIYSETFGDTDQKPIIQGASQVATTFFKAVPGGPNAWELGNFSIVGQVVLNDLILSMIESFLIIFHQHDHGIQENNELEMSLQGFIVKNSRGMKNSQYFDYFMSNTINNSVRSKPKLSDILAVDFGDDFSHAWKAFQAVYGVKYFFCIETCDMFTVSGDIFYDFFNILDGLK